MKWVLAALATLILWGFWGVLLKKVSGRAEWYEVYAATNIAIVIGVSVVIGWKGLSAVTAHGFRWFLLALLTGAAGTVGYVFLVLSLKWGGKASVVIPLTSLYPALNVVLAILLLGETVTLRQALGIILAIGAILLLSS